jgi:O-antigen ligase
MMVLIVFILIGVIFVAGQQNNYFARLWTYWTEGAGGELNFFQYIAFDQRFLYWGAAYDIFQHYPLVGVGLGNYTFYFAEHLPDVSLYRVPEILRKLTPSPGVDQIVTVKSLHVRLLAETGIAGTAAFAAFVIAIAGCVVWLLKPTGLETRFWGMAGVLVLLVFALAGFSFDSFALPNMWVVFGFLSAAYHLHRHSHSLAGDEEDPALALR